MHTYTPANSIFDGPITNLLSTLCVLMEVLFHAPAKRGEREKKSLNGFKFWRFYWSFSDWRCVKHDSERVPSKHAGSVPKAFWLRPACSQNGPGSYMPDRTSCIRFSSALPKKVRITLCRTDPDPIWMVWSGFGQTRLVWKQAGMSELSGPVCGRTQPARYQFHTFRLGSVLPQTSWIILSKTIPDAI